MAASRNAGTNPNRYRNVFITGLVLGIIATILLKALFGEAGVKQSDIADINTRLESIDQKISATPTPAPISAATAAGTSAVTISSINKDPQAHVGKEVTVSGKVTNAFQGVGFIMVDTDGSFFWVHTKDKIPAATATVKGTVNELKDQIAQWKTEPGWPADDSNLTTKLRTEKIFVEASSVS